MLLYNFSHRTRFLLFLLSVYLIMNPNVTSMSPNPSLPILFLLYVYTRISFILVDTTQQYVLYILTASIITIIIIVFLAWRGHRFLLEFFFLVLVCVDSSLGPVV